MKKAYEQATQSKEDDMRDLMEGLEAEDFDAEMRLPSGKKYDGVEVGEGQRKNNNLLAIGPPGGAGGGPPVRPSKMPMPKFDSTGELIKRKSGVTE